MFPKVFFKQTMSARPYAEISPVLVWNVAKKNTCKHRKAFEVFFLDPIIRGVHSVQVRMKVHQGLPLRENVMRSEAVRSILTFLSRPAIPRLLHKEVLWSRSMIGGAFRSSGQYEFARNEGMSFGSIPFPIE